ncbi:MAG: DUF4440 domain-containing protein [Desulfobacterium sp.]|nr:DUF4440 domain-containing protein [Desulfobacterium sp.]
MSKNIEANKSVVRRYLRAVVNADAEKIESLHHPDAKYWTLGRGDIDRNTYIGGTKMLLSASKRRIDIKTITAEDDRVCVECEAEFVFGDRVYRNIYSLIFTVQDDVIVQAHEYMDPRASEKAIKLS